MAARDYLTLPEAAKFSAYGRATMDRWRRTGKLRCEFVGGAWWTKAAWVKAVEDRARKTAETTVAKGNGR
jgi:3-hydroxy-3-methylglutaryl CoA synthase